MVGARVRTAPSVGTRCLYFICSHHEAVVLFQEGCHSQWGTRRWADGRLRGGRPGGGKWGIRVGRG